MIIALFIIKVAAGCLNAWISLKLSIRPDILIFHTEGLYEYHLLFTDPWAYFSNIFKSGYPNGYAGILGSGKSYWNDLTSNIIVNFLSVCDVFTFGGFYANVIFYNFVTFFGMVALFSVFNLTLKNNKRIIIFSCFLLPSVLYFSSAIHKEGLILATMGIFMYNLYHILNGIGFRPLRIFYALLSLIFIFLLRNYVFFAALPAAIAWILSHKKKYPPLITFMVIYIIGAVLFFNAALFIPQINLPEIVSRKQVEFINLPKPASYIQTNHLEPDFKSWWINAPQSLNHSLLRPYLADFHLSRLILPFSIELIFYECIILAFLLFPKKGAVEIIKDPFFLSCFFLSAIALLIIGYTVPIIGALVRYKSIYLPLIFTPVLCNIDSNKLLRLIRIKK